MTRLEAAWSQFVMDLMVTPPRKFCSMRRMFNGIDHEIPFDDFDGIEMDSSALQYASWKTKFAQLDRNYLNVEALEALNAKFLSRVGKDQTAVTARFGNLEKKKDSMGFCLQTISLSYLKKPLDGSPSFVIEIYYRSTEVGQKFLADLAYLVERVFPIILKDIPIKPDAVRFRFCTLYVSPMFIPIVMQVRGPLTIVEHIRNGDPYWFNRILGSTLKAWCAETNPYNWRTQKLQWENFNDNVLSKMSRPDIRKLNRLMTPVEE